MRNRKEIQRACDRLEERLWLERHLTLKEKRRSRGETEGASWAEADRLARELEARLPAEETGPYSDWEFGMMNGKLSALRWVLGSDWDDLST